MKIILLTVLLIGTLFGADRPKIALVLSGGGARGGAHVGVLKVLEENKIPIDMIVGTSMGSFVGGMYVAGMTPDEIEKMLTTTDWKKHITTDFNRQDIPMRKKNLDYLYQGRLGLGVNAKGNLVLPTGVLNRQPMLLKFMQLTQNVEDIRDFDKLSIPYRAIATNIENGDAVILKSGSLSKSIYASSSIPGGFQPINIDGINLVDGGVSDNFPIQVAKDMGADIIIAVDVSENFSKNLDVNSYFVVMGQLINILMRKNANESITKLSKDDILLTPDLVGYGGLDADKYKEIIQTGVDAAQKSVIKLKDLSVSDVEYKKWQKKHRVKHNYQKPIIDKIEIDNPSYFSNESIRQRLHQQESQPLDLTQLRADLLHLYNMMIFDSVDYTIRKEKGKNILVITTTPSWDNQGEVHFAIGIEDDFVGHSAYSLKLGYTMYGLNSYGGEWRTDFEIGRYKKAATEWFQPLDTMQRYYIRPSLSYDSVTDLYPNDIDGLDIGNQELFSSRGGASFVFGAHVTTNYEFEIGASLFDDRVDIPIFNLPKFAGVDSHYKYKSRPIFATIKTDNLDNVNFPKQGMKTELRWTKEMKMWGSDYDYDQAYAEIEKPFTFERHNLTLFAKYGNTYHKNEPTDMQRVSGLFILGGLFNLSGYAPYSFYGDNVFLGVLKYSYQLKDGGFFGSLNAPLYAGFSLEGGNAWDNSASSTLDTVKVAGTVYVAADTFLGPLYLAYGFNRDRKESVYLYLGEKF